MLEKWNREGSDRIDMIFLYLKCVETEGLLLQGFIFYSVCVRKGKTFCLNIKTLY